MTFSSSVARIFRINSLVQHLSRMLFKVLVSIALIHNMRFSVNEHQQRVGGGGGVVQAGSHMRMTQRNNHGNISELLDNLLRGYDNSIRPDFGGPPATIEVDIMVRSMGPISEVDMTYSMDCYFRQSWVDKRLAFEGGQDTLALSVSMLARIWKPDTYFYNGKQSYLHTITTPNKFVRIHQNGRVLYSSRLTIKAGCPMNLEDFPMDIQKCPLKFGSFGYTTSDVVYRWNKERPAVAIAEDMKLSQFDLVDCPAGNSTDIVYKTAPSTSYELSSSTSSKKTTQSQSSGQSAKSGDGGGSTEVQESKRHQRTINEASEYSMLMVNFHLQRHMGNFLIQVYGPCCLLVVLSWVSFWLNREATADRVSLGITTVLTMTFLGLEARTDLPKVPYPTALDFFVFLSFAFIFATILQFAVVHYFTKYGSGECYFIVDDADSDADSEVDETTLKTLSNIPSDFNVSTDSKIYEVIPLSMCSIAIPPSSSSGGGGGGGGGRRRSSYRYSCFGWNWNCFRKNDRNRMARNISDDDEEIVHLRSGEDLSVRSTGGRRRMSSYRREESQAKKKGKRTPKFNSVSKIDRASRIVFPLLFFIINIFYWCTYLSRSSRILSESTT